MAGDLESKTTKDELKLTFGWQGISYSVRTKSGKKDILRNVRGFLKSGIFMSETGLIVGEMLAVMGPSGCGKTTLLNILSRRLKAVIGISNIRLLKPRFGFDKYLETLIRIR